MAFAVERKFLDDAGCHKSLRQDDFASAPLSPRIASLKSKKFRLKSSVVHRGLWAESSDLDSGGIKNKDCNTPSSNPLQDRKPEEMSHTRVSNGGTENNARSQSRPVTIQRSLTRSKTILRLFSSKILARSSSTDPTPSQPLLRSRTQIVSAFGSKETRDAALRERGLLPPLNPDVDLSLAERERERDRHLPVMTPPQSGEAFERDISAAAKVKQEWEAKYKDTRDPEEMKISTPSQAVKENSLRGRSSTPIEQPSSYLEVPTSSPLAIISTSSIKDTQTSSTHDLSNDLDDPDYPIPHSPSSEPYSIPLPPSPLPLPSLSFLCSQEDLPLMFWTASSPLPPTPGLTALPVSPTITVTPPIIHASASPSESLIESKSLHSTVVHQVIPIVMAASNSITPVYTETPILLDKSDAVMTESPVETPLTGMTSNSSCPRNSTDFKVAITSDVSAAGSAVLPKARVRNHTDPTLGGLKTHSRKSSFNLFKRYTDPPLNTALPRRLSMGASINNLRRSFVGTLSRTKAPGLAVKTDQGFHASHIPPSPTAAYADQMCASPDKSLKFLQEQQFTTSPEPKPRVPVSPTLYSRGTIVAEMNNIEDEESRRMTELAFLG